MMELFIYVFLYLSGFCLACNLFDLTYKPYEKLWERILILAILLVWPLTLAVGLVIVSVLCVRKIMVR